MRSSRQIMAIFWCMTADPLYQRALQICEKMLEPDHEDTASTLGNLAGVYVFQGNYAAAELQHLRAVSISEKALGLQHPQAATALGNLASVYMDQGKYADAVPPCERDVSIKAKAYPASHPDVAFSLVRLACLQEAITGDINWHPMRYVAWITHSADGPPAVLVDLGEAAETLQAIGSHHIYLQHLYFLPLPYSFRPLLRTLKILHLRSTWPERNTEWKPQRDAYIRNRVDDQIGFYKRRFVVDNRRLEDIHSLFHFGDCRDQRKVHPDSSVAIERSIAGVSWNAGDCPARAGCGRTVMVCCSGL